MPQIDCAAVGLEHFLTTYATTLQTIPIEIMRT